MKVYFKLYILTGLTAVLVNERYCFKNLKVVNINNNENQTEQDKNENLL